jgi:hypothetical protein
VNDRVEPPELRRPDVPNVEPQLGNRANALGEIAFSEEVAVQTDHFVAGVEQQRYHHGSDVALVPRY